MNSTTVGTQLYPASRLAGMSDTDLDRVMRFALADRAETSTTVYDGMTRHATVLTAQRTIGDIAGEQNRRCAVRFAGAYSATDTAAKIYAQIR